MITEGAGLLSIKGRQRKAGGYLNLVLDAILLLLIVGLSSYLRWTKVPEEFRGLLSSDEYIVDYERNHNVIYGIISSRGQAEYGDLLVILHKEPDGTWARSYENDFTGLKPWMLQLADVDGDGGEEIITAVRKTTHFDKVERNRLFVFNYTDGILIKKWTGSQIAGNWNYFLAENLLPIPGSELVFVENTENRNEKISIYYWFDFGFLKLAESKPYKDIINLTVQKENQIQITWRNDEDHITNLMVNDGKIIEIK